MLELNVLLNMPVKTVNKQLHTRLVLTEVVCGRWGEGIPECEGLDKSGVGSEWIELKGSKISNSLYFILKDF